MADDKKDNADKDKKKSAEETDQTSPSENNNSKMKLIVIMALCMVLLSVTAMVSTIFLTISRDTTQVAAVDNKAKSSESVESKEKDTSEDQDNEDNEENEASEDVDNGPPLFYQFNPTFIVNIPAKGRAKFLQVQVQVMSYNSKVIDSIEQYAPLIKNDLVQLFSQQEYNDLLKPDSKEKLRMESLKLIKTLLTKHTGEDGVEQVLFTSFITQ